MAGRNPEAVPSQHNSTESASLQQMWFIRLI